MVRQKLIQPSKILACPVHRACRSRIDAQVLCGMETVKACGGWYKSRMSLARRGSFAASR